MVQLLRPFADSIYENWTAYDSSSVLYLVN